MELDLTRIFVKVVQYQSFAKAAAALKMPRSTVSKSITRLERETGTKLLVRSTRSLTVTQAGRAFYDSISDPIQRIEDAQKSLYGQDNLLTGTVRITAPEDLGTHVVAPAIARLSSEHSMLKFEMHYSDDRIDLIKQGFDLGVRVGPIRDSGLILKRAGEVTLVLVASPAYLKGKQKIKTPKDLMNHNCLSLNLPQTAERWSLKSLDKTAHVPIQPKILSNQMNSLLSMALADGGIALVPTYICQFQLDNGSLVRVLPEWKNSGWPVSLVSPLAPSSSARLKVTVERILSALIEVLG